MSLDMLMVIAKGPFGQHTHCRTVYSHDIIHGSAHLGPTCRQGSRGMREHRRLREQGCMLQAQPHDMQEGVMKGSCTGAGNAARGTQCAAELHTGAATLQRRSKSKALMQNAEGMLHAAYVVLLLLQHVVQSLLHMQWLLMAESLARSTIASTAATHLLLLPLLLLRLFRQIVKMAAIHDSHAPPKKNSSHSTRWRVSRSMVISVWFGAVVQGCQVLGQCSSMPRDTAP